MRLPVLLDLLVSATASTAAVSLALLRCCSVQMYHLTHSHVDLELYQTLLKWVHDLS